RRVRRASSQVRGCAPKVSGCAQLLVVVGKPFGEARLAQARVRAGRERGVGQFGAEVAGMLLAYDLARVVVGGKYATDQLGEVDFLRPRDLDGTVDRVGHGNLGHWAATSLAAIGWRLAAGTCTVSPSVAESAVARMNSKNWVERTMVYGWPALLIRSSCASLARMYPLSGTRSAPTIVSATWCPTPAFTSALSRFRPELWKNSSTAASSKDGELATSTTTCAPASA